MVEAAQSAAGPQQPHLADEDSDALWHLQASDSSGGYGPSGAVPLLSAEEHDEALRQRIRAMIRDGALTVTFQHEPLPLSEQLHRERTYLARTIFNAVGEPQVPRYPGEEGLFVPPRTEMPDWDMYKLYSRLSREDPRRTFFFDENGHMIHAPEQRGDPLSRVFELRDPFLPPDPRLAVVVNAPQQRAQSRQWLPLVLNVARVRVEDHPLFTLEDRLCVALRREVERWHRRRAVDVTQHYTSRIAALRARVEGQVQRLQAILARLAAPRPPSENHNNSHNSGGGDSGEGETLQALKAVCASAVQEVLSGLARLKEARVARDEEWAAEQRHFADIYAAWQRVKAFREQTGAVYASMGYNLATTLTNNTMNTNTPTPTGEGGSIVSPREGVASASAAAQGAAPAAYVGFPLSLKVRRTATDHAAELAAWRNDELAELDEARRARELLNVLEDLEEEANNSSADAQYGGKKPSLEQLMFSDGGAALQAQLAGLDEDQRARQLAVWEAEVRRERFAAREKQRRRAFDATGEFERVRARMLASRRPPGRPLLEPLLDLSTPVTPEASCPPAEVKRRQRIGSTLLYVTLHVNGRPVAAGDKAPLRFPQWTADVNFAARLQLTAAPRSVVFALRQDALFTDPVLAEFFLPVPDLAAQPHLREVTAAGRRFTAPLPAPDAPADRFHEVSAVCSAFWNVPAHVLKDPDVLRAFAATNDVSLPAPTSHRRGGGAAAAAHQRDLASIDPNDPRNALLADLARRGDPLRAAAVATAADSNGGSSGGGFSGWEVCPDLLLVNEEYYVPSARKRLLRARRDALFLREPVPLREDQFSEEALATLARLAETETGDGDGDGSVGAHGRGEPGFSAVTAMAKRVQDLTGPGLTYDGTGESGVPGGPVPASVADNAARMPSAAALAALRQSLAGDAATGPVDLHALERPLVLPSADAAAAEAHRRREERYYGVALPNSSGNSGNNIGAAVTVGGGRAAENGALVLAGSAASGTAMGLVDGRTGDRDLATALGLVGARNELAVTDVSDVVYEQVNPDLVMTSTFMRDLFRPVRPLFVYRDDVRAVTNPRSCALVCQVLRASNVPLRTSASASSSSSGPALVPGQTREAREGARAAALNCVVQVSFQESVRKTSPAAGPHPRWQEVLHLPFTTPNDSYDAASLLQLQSPVLVALYDQVTVSNEVIDARFQRTQLASVDLRYLGSVEIPFSTIFAASTIEGAFEVRFFAINKEQALLFIHAKC